MQAAERESAVSERALQDPSPDVTLSSTGEQHRISRHRHFADFAPGIQVLLHGDNGNPAAQHLEVEHMRRAHVAAAAPRVVHVIQQVPLG